MIPYWVYGPCNKLNEWGEWLLSYHVNEEKQEQQEQCSAVQCSAVHHTGMVAAMGAA